MGFFDHLPTMAEAYAKPRACPKGPTRLDVKAEKAKDDAKAHDAFRKAVIARDGKKCRCCRKKVVDALALVPRRLEVHHLHGRIGALRFDPRCALVLCASCHQRVTGKVNDRLFIVQPAAQMFQVDGKSYIDAAKAVTFKESEK